MSDIDAFVHITGTEKHIAEAVLRRLEQANDKPVLLFVSGGSAFKVLDHIDPEVLLGDVTISLVDDRFSQDPDVNNFIQLTRTRFYQKARTREVTFFSSVPEERESLEDVSRRWEKAIRQWDSTHSADRTVLAILGVGLDGHTAGIMPFPEDPHKFHALFEDETKWFVAYDAGNKNQYPLRITASISFLKRMVDYAFVYVAGEKKKNILKTVMTSTDVVAHPASVIRLMKHVEVYSYST